MRNSKKKMALVLATVFSVAALPGFGACVKKEKTINNEQTVNIKVMKAGYGVDWLYELENVFETVYAEEGYQVNILEPSPDYSHSVVINELYQGYENTGIDLYITGLTAESVGVNGEYKKVLVEDIRESVFNQPAISFDGTDEEKTVGEKLSPDVLPFVCDSTGAMYGFNWVQEVAGLAVNTRKLAKYYANGEYELPRTTNELFECIENIYLGANGQPSSATSGTHPVTYFAGQNGYQVCMMMTWLKQYDLDFYNEFWAMEKDGNAMIENGYEVFNNPAVTDMLANAYRFIDPNIAANGSGAQTLDQAQAKIMKDKDGAVFYAVGGWFINEVKLNYKDYLNDVEFINFPVTSALGTKLFGKDTAYNFNEEKCDKLLSAIIKLVDENKSIEEISAAISPEFGSIATADLETVAKSRGVFYSRGTEQLAVITKNALGKEVAAKFLRMMASDDFAEIFSDLANATTPYTDKENTTTKYKFVNQSSKISTNRYKSLISHRATGFRKVMDLTSPFLVKSHIPAYIASLEGSSIVSIYNDNGTKTNKPVSIYTDAAKALQKEEYDNAYNNWSDWLETAGIKK